MLYLRIKINPCVRRVMETKLINEHIKFHRQLQQNVKPSSR